MKHTNIHVILAEVNENNKTNNKIAVMKKYKDSEILQQVLKMTYDIVEFTYGVSLKQIAKFEPKECELPINLEFALSSIIYNLVNRNVTGHAAYQLCANLIGNLSVEDAELVKKIINRDLRINFGRTQINKIWKGLISKTCYMRCGIYNDKTKKKITFPSIIQLKSDGTYREFSVQNTEVTARSRSAESYEYPQLFNSMKEYNDGIYTGELTVKCSDNIIKILKEKLKVLKRKGEDTEAIENVFIKYEKNKNYILPRSLGNGLINSDDVPHDDLVLDLWDYITHEEYQNAIARKKNTTKYSKRFELLQLIVNKKPNSSINIIPTHYINSLQEALKYVTDWMNSGLEGGVLKNLSGLFRDGTSTDQLKLKVVFDIDVRIVGYIEGKPGTKRAETFGSLMFSTDDGLITGNVGGINDNMLKEINDNRELYLNKIIEIQGNDLTKATGSSTWSMSHPRFSEIRNDKDYTDTLERAQENLEMSKLLS